MSVKLLVAVTAALLICTTIAGPFGQGGHGGDKGGDKGGDRGGFNGGDKNGGPGGRGGPNDGRGGHHGGNNGRPPKDDGKPPKDDGKPPKDDGRPPKDDGVPPQTRPPIRGDAPTPPPPTGSEQLTICGKLSNPDKDGWKKRWSGMKISKRGSSVYGADATKFPTRLKVSPGDKDITAEYQTFPERGTKPDMDETQLTKLSSKIISASVALFKTRGNEIVAAWYGKDALKPVQAWSATKWIAPLQLVATIQENTDTPLENWKVKRASGAGGWPFLDVLTDVFTEKEQIGTSNALAGMLEEFATTDKLEKWIRDLTGNDVSFKGMYGAPPFVNDPVIVDGADKELLSYQKSGVATEAQTNLVSTYDLTRLISMFALHPHLDEKYQIPGLKESGVDSLSKVFALDVARYADEALATIGMNSIISDVVVLSKIGAGYSEENKRNEVVYTMYLKFKDNRDCGVNIQGTVRDVALTVNAYGESEDTVDVTVAKSVAELLTSVLTGVLDDDGGDS